jgi:hypothetical protein
MRVKPTNAVSTRLEQVRRELGYSNLKRFHAALIEEAGYTVSYEAVRKYHYDRVPPTDYLVRVAERFGVRLEWLAAGKGEMRDPLFDETEGRIIDSSDDPFEGGSNSHAVSEHHAMLSGVKAEFRYLPTLSWASNMATFAPMMALTAYLAEDPTIREDMGAVVRLAEDFGRRVGKSFAVPLQLLGVDPEYLPAHEMERYLLGMTFALGAIDFRQFFEAERVQQRQASQRGKPES